MTQIRITPNSPAQGTHVLIVGVGYYRHLIDGPEQRKRGVHLGLSVLESPPVSAEQFARWLLGLDGDTGGGFNNPAAPLATVELLISSRNPISLSVDGTAHTIEPATLASVRHGFDRWLDEVRRHDDNVGV